MTGFEFLGTDTWKEFRTQIIQTGWAVIGHNRKATRGSIIAENAHPFWVEDKLVLVHNGSFNGSHKHIKDTVVDSDAIAHLLAEAGDGNYEKALQKVNAAYALIFYDIENKKLQLIRNPDRPLAWAETADGWYFASESSMLEFALKRADIKVLNNAEFPEYTLNTWKLTEDKSSELTSEVLDCKYRWQAGHREDKGDVWYPTNNYDRFQRHPMACGWGDNDDLTQFNDELKSSMNKSPLDDVTVSNPLKDVTPTIVDVSTNKSPQVSITVMPWMKKVTMGDWKTLKENYRTDSKIHVIVDDYLDDDQKTQEVMVSGKTLDEGSHPVVFKVKRKTLEVLTHPDHANADNAIFEVVVDYVGWRRVDKHKPGSNLDAAEGIMVIQGKSSNLLFDGTGVGHNAQH